MFFANICCQSYRPTLENTLNRCVTDESPKCTHSRLDVLCIGKSMELSVVLKQQIDLQSCSFLSSAPLSVSTIPFKQLSETKQNSISYHWILAFLQLHHSEMSVFINTVNRYSEWKKARESFKQWFPERVFCNYYYCINTQKMWWLLAFHTPIFTNWLKG